MEGMKSNLAEQDSIENDSGGCSSTSTGAGGAGTSIPRVVKFGFKDFKTSSGKWSASCNFCKKTLTDKIGVSSTFTK